MRTKSKALLWFFAAAIVIVLAVLAIKGYVTGGKYRSSLEYSYARSLGDLTDELETISSALEKSSVASTATMQHQVSAEILASGGEAKAAISYLPFNDEKAGMVQKLISVTQDYAMYAGRKLASGEAFNEDDVKNFSSMREYIEKLRDSLSKIRVELGESDLKIGKAERLLNETLNVPDAPAFDDGLQSVTEEMDSFPTLLYDGPFSDHIQQKEAEFLKGKEKINEEQAVERAAKFLDVDISSLKFTSLTEGALAAYQVRGENMSVNVTEAGGEISWAKKSVDIDESKLGYEEALEKAKEFLQKSGIENVKENYYIINDNTCTINFNAVQDEVLLYPDLIKITIELSEGGVVEYSADGYLMNHKEREIPQAAVSMEQAQEKINGELQVTKSATAIIPTEGKNEVLTYEFTCEKSDGTEMLVYINADTGLEEKIYTLVKSDTGVMVK